MFNVKTVLKKVSKTQCIEFGQVMVLVTLFLALYFKEGYFVSAAFVLMLITITVPIVFYPFAAGWFKLSEILSSASSKVILSMVFFLVVIPVGLCRKLFGIDNLQVKKFKKGNESVMIFKDHLYTKQDIINTF